ncbi:MAG: VOC family protein [Myxococcota bacterium]
MNQFIPKNVAVWFEIPVTDLERAKAFYSAVTDIPLKEQAPGPKPIAVFETSDPEGGIAGHLYPGTPAPEGGQTVHLAVKSPLEEALQRVKEHGGQVLSDIISIPAGRFAYCEDPDGNSVGFFDAN